MTAPSPQRSPLKPQAAAAVLALMVLTGVMLLALFTRTPPHPPLEVPPFALAPFLGASLALGAAALHRLHAGASSGHGLAATFALTALVSFGPQKYLDPAFPQIWPAVVTAQLAILVVAGSCIGRFRQSRTPRPS